MTKDQYAGQGGSYEMIDGVRVLVQRTEDGGQKTEDGGQKTEDIVPTLRVGTSHDAGKMPALQPEPIKGGK